MARIRSIKPEINEDARTARLSDRAWRLFVSSWLLADDAGNLRAEVDYLHGQVFWGAPGTRDDTQAALLDLVSAQLLSTYAVRGQLYASVKGWEKHQRIDHPGQPRCPGPGDPESQTCKPDELVTDNSREPHEALAPDPGSGNREQGTGTTYCRVDTRQGGGHFPLAENQNQPLLLEAHRPVRQRFDFEALYRTYPRKEGKQRGLELCRKQVTTEADYQALGVAIANFARLMRTEKREPTKVKHFSTFMGCWRDYLSLAESHPEAAASAPKPATGYRAIVEQCKQSGGPCYCGQHGPTNGEDGAI